MTLRKLGMRLEAARRARGLKQDQLVEELKKLRAASVHKDDEAPEPAQSLIARIERGLVHDPKAGTIRDIALVLGVEYEDLVATLIEDKYKIAPEKTSLLSRSLKTLGELAEWEGQQHAVWVAAMRFVDPEDPRFKRSVNSVLQRGGEVKFFIPADLLSRFKVYKELEGQGENDKLCAVPLDLGQEAVLATHFSIGNPYHSDGEDLKMSGYLILNDENTRPYLGVKMYPEEVINRRNYLKYIDDTYSKKARIVTMNQADRLEGAR